MDISRYIKDIQGPWPHQRSFGQGFWIVEAVIPITSSISSLGSPISVFGMNFSQDEVVDWALSGPGSFAVLRFLSFKQLLPKETDETAKRKDHEKGDHSSQMQPKSGNLMERERERENCKK